MTIMHFTHRKRRRDSVLRPQVIYLFRRCSDSVAKLVAPRHGKSDSPAAHTLSPDWSGASLMGRRALYKRYKRGEGLDESSYPVKLLMFGPWGRQPL